MKIRLFLIISIITLSLKIMSQDIIYTITCEKDGQNSILDSISVYNISNGTRITFGDLPGQSNYAINLSTQELQTPSGIKIQETKENFKILKNIPGELSLECLNQKIGGASFSVYNINGQRLFYQSIEGYELQDQITVYIPFSGIYFLNIISSVGSESYKMVGANDKGNLGYSFSQKRTNNLNAVFKSALIEDNGNFSFQEGDSLQFIAFYGGINSYPVMIAAQNSDTLKLIMETNPEDYFDLEGIKYQINMGTVLWYSELDCGNFDVYAHGLSLTSNIFYTVFGDNESGMSLLPTGKGNILNFYILSKDSELIPGEYLFVDDVDCNGIVTDNDQTYAMNATDKYVSASLETSFFTYYAFYIDLDFNWEEVDFDNPSAEVTEKFNYWIGAMVGIKEGTVNIEKTDNIYTITFECTDYNGKEISGQYIGELEYVEFGI